MLNHDCFLGLKPQIVEVCMYKKQVFGNINHESFDFESPLCTGKFLVISIMNLLSLKAHCALENFCNTCLWKKKWSLIAFIQKTKSWKVGFVYHMKFQDNMRAVRYRQLNEMKEHWGWCTVVDYWMNLGTQYEVHEMFFPRSFFFWGGGLYSRRFWSVWYCADLEWVKMVFWKVQKFESIFLSWCINLVYIYKRSLKQHLNQFCSPTHNLYHSKLWLHSQDAFLLGLWINISGVLCFVHRLWTKSLCHLQCFVFHFIWLCVACA